MNIIKDSDAKIMAKVNDKRKHLKEISRHEELRKIQSEGMLVIPSCGRGTFDQNERILSKFEKCGNKEKSSIREWFRKLFAVIGPLKLSEEAIRRTILVNLQGDPCTFYLDNETRPLPEVVHRLIDQYDRSYKKPGEVVDMVKKAKRGADEDLHYFMSDLAMKLDQVAATFEAGTYEVTKRIILKDKLLESVGEHTLRRLNEMIAEAQSGMEPLDIEKLCKDAVKFESFNGDWGKKKSSSKVNQMSISTRDLGDARSRESVQSVRSSEWNSQPMDDKPPTLIRAEQEHYMKSMLNVMVTAQIRSMRPEDMRDMDSADEEEVDQDLKLSSLPDNPSQRMTKEDAEKYWGDIPKEIADFEMQVERTERQRSEQSNRGGKWKRTFEQRRLESARPGTAWQYRKDRINAVSKPGEALPRYNQYHGNRGGGGVQAVERLPNGENSILYVCSRCGWEGASQYKSWTSPPVAFVANKDGFLRPGCLPGVLMELGHPSRDCPRYDRTATYPCSQCRNQGRIAFHFTNECKEMIGSQALAPAAGVEEKMDESGGSPTSAPAPKN